jgi:bacillithiol biosynthesis deacetylase BshB1
VSDSLDVLAVFAHPDDAALLCGGALIRSTDRGERTGVLDLTRGEMGSRGSVEIRAREAEAAAQVLGLAVRANAEIPDAAVMNTPENRARVVGFIRELRPRVVVTHWVEGRHPDHRAAAQLVHDAAFLSGLKRFEAPGDPFRPLKVVYALSYRESAPSPTFVLDITEQMDRKIQALACYESQFDGNERAGELLPAGDRPLFDQVRAQCAHYGSLIRCAYGEPFWTRETMDVETLGSLGVSTF